jgi:hypothetical protein
MRKERYPDGYMPKIDYWQYKFDSAKGEKNLSAMSYALEKLKYFTDKELERQNILCK